MTFFTRSILALMCAAVLAVTVRAATPTVRPEEVGLSAERLKRVTELMQRHIDAKTFSGAVTLVARNGRIAHFEAQGLMDLESKKPMQKDAIFRIMSMTKPVVGVAVMMLVEDGKLRLTDPVVAVHPRAADSESRGAQYRGCRAARQRDCGAAADADRRCRAPDYGPRSAHAHLGVDERRRQRGAGLAGADRRRERRCPW